MIKRPPSVATNSPQALSLTDCLAKTIVDSEGKKAAGRTIVNHCHIVGEVARELIARMPTWLQAELFPPGSELIAACHDLGKVSPTFQEKIYRGTQGYQANSKPELKGAEPEDEKQWGGHAGVSQTAADDLDVGRYIPEILGQHHGYSPNLSQLATDAVFGGKAWQQRREELLNDLKSLLGCEFPKVKSPEQARILAGLTSVADWIGSGSLFDNPAINVDRALIQQALDNAGFIKPLFKSGLEFADIFSFAARDIQQQLINHCQQPGVYVLEAPMGIGKTEAALYAAYQLMQSNQSTGLYFALPTQLTSDKIHERVNQFLTQILLDESPHRQALLLHGSAWLKEKELGVEGNPSGSWFDDKKRGLLAPFAVGTIDQALMAVMNVKHGFVRTFGLAGKVVILDEVHSYDAYTGTLLDELVNNLRELHCTVIILSATLTQQRRKALLSEIPQSRDYPLISAKPNQGDVQEVTTVAMEEVTVQICTCLQDSEAIDEALKRAEAGQQVLWIENTVAEAQAIFQHLSAIDIPIEVGLLHSRFLKTDRADKEKQWVALYGKDNAVARQAKGRILVGTQVLEQSLDIDADFLVTRFAPTDMLLQRLGRLWRHKDSYRPDAAKREAWILVPELQAAIDNAKDQFGKSANVYSPYVLCRSLQVWHDLKIVALPSQIRDLIEATYVERDEQGAMRVYQAALEKVREKLELLALNSVSKNNKTQSDDKASTRYSEQDTVQVLLLKAYQHDLSKKLTRVTLLNDKVLVLPQHVKAYDKPQWRKLAADLLQSTVQVVDCQAPQALPIKALEGLREFIYLGDPAQGESLLRVALVDEAENIRSLVGGVASEVYQLGYDKKFGYRAEK
jgi:CRISPR-associated endonuclease/helicase Cas3